MNEPTYASDVIRVQFDELDSYALDTIPRMLMQGFVVILAGVFTREECDEMVAQVTAWGDEREPSFHKILTGVPDFHRIIDRQSSDAYSVTSVRHGYYYFRQNNHPIWRRVAPLWRVFETLAGIPHGKYVNSRPSDGVVERLIFYAYPNGGMLGTHVDPTNHHAIVVGGTLSERGRDFTAGGLYAIGKDGLRMDLEPHMRAGDFMLCYPTVKHGVAPIETNSARWFMGLSIVDSDHVAERVTAERVGT